MKEKMLVFMIEVSLAVYASYISMTEDQRKMIQMRAWHAAGNLSKYGAEKLGRLAMKTEREYARVANG